MRAEQLLEMMMRPRFDLSQTLVIPIKSQNTSIGPSAYVKVAGVYQGFDWDKGKLQFRAEGDVYCVDESFLKQKSRNMELSESVARMWMVHKSNNFTPEQKYREMIRFMKNLGFGKYE